MLTVDKAAIARKKEKLDACRAYLKEEFIGIDDIIDGLIGYLSVWYLMPELLTRPVIINLWGMTGVGKTDLVRKLIRFLEFQDRFVEIDLTGSNLPYYQGSVLNAFTEAGLNDGQPAAVFFDEIQRFNSIDSNGDQVKRLRFSDFWELLSDGKLTRRDREEFEDYIYDYLKECEEEKDEGEEVRRRRFGMTSYDARSLRNLLGLDQSLEELSKLSKEDIFKRALELQREKRIYEPVDHSRTLIFISGNLDEAYSMSGMASEADVDADIFRAFTEKITLVDIKDALSQKFHPEQVARFGNLHLIYRSLGRADFAELIRREIREKTERVREQFGITVTVSDAVHDLIYRNGVFPVQGVRPVFSAIVDVLESNWNDFLLDSLLRDCERVAFDYDPSNKQLLVDVGGTVSRIPYVGCIDQIRQSSTPDRVANISVHESGHAVAYMVLTGMAPLQLKSKLASSYAGGFTFPHEIHLTRSTIFEKIIVYLAGGAAEELIFGEEHASAGRSDDRKRATALAADYVRRYGFDPDFQAAYGLRDERHRLDSDPTDARIEALMAELGLAAQKLLEEHLPLLHALSLELGERGSLETKAVAALAAEHGVEVSVRPEGYLHIYGYRGHAPFRTFANRS